MAPLLAAPQGEGDDPHQDQNDRYREERQENEARGPGAKRHVASEEECLAALSRIPALILLGMLTTAKANAMRGSYAAILQHYRQKQIPTDRGVADDALVDILSRNPEFANMLEPLLSAEQIASILARAKEGSDGTA